MRRSSIPVLVALPVIGVLILSTRTCAQSALDVRYGDQGIEQLSYGGVVLEDLTQNSSDAFHIWHMKATDLQGNVLTQGEYGWGENNNGKSWDPTSRTWTYKFTWGTIAVSFAQNGNTLNITVKTTNLANSGITFDGATVYPFALHFPQLPNGFGAQSTPQLAFNTTAPSVTVADYGKGLVAAVVPQATKPLYSGFEPTGAANGYTPLISGTTPDGLATFQPHNDRPIQPGQTDTEVVSLRFAPSGTSTATIASDVYRDWVKALPPTLNWTDRRILGTVYLASSPQGSPTQPGGYPNNPRRYFNDSNAADFDVTTPTGLAAFQARVLQQAANNVQNLQRLNAQGAITWDIEGEQYPQPTSYACSPDQVAALAPEMESVVNGQASAYNGMKLDDAYFRTMHDAGFRIGVCVRPQHFTLNSDGTASQVYLPSNEVYAELLRKMKYAHDRWGVTLFYVDSSVDANGAALDPSIFKELAAQLPDSLISPEESSPKDYAYAAPFQSFLFHTDLGTDPSVYNYYPKAFSLNLVNDVDPNKLAQYMSQLTQSVQRGDILMVHADYWQANNPTVMQIYQNAAAGK